MWQAVRRWRDAVGDAYALGLVRIALGLLLFAGALRAARELQDGLLRRRVSLAHPSRGARSFPERLRAAGHRPGAPRRPGRRRSPHQRPPRAPRQRAPRDLRALCDRLQFHNNRWALYCYAALLAFAPCDRSFHLGPPPVTRVGPLWAARLAQIQLALIYVASGGSKLLDPDWRDGRVLLERFRLYGAAGASPRGCRSACSTG